MTKHTTIQITKEQAQQLQELRQYDDEPYKSVIARLIMDDNSAIANQEVTNDMLMDELQQLMAIQSTDSNLEGRIKDLQTEIKTLQERLER